MTASSFQLPSLPFRTKPFTTGWVWVLCVIGLDYLSSLAYVPSVAFSVAGSLAPLVIAVVVVVTLFLATPLFCYIAGRSPNGHGSIGLLERLMPGWRGKFLVVVILGFVATDLIFTRTFSAADATEHMLHSPVMPWQHTLDELANVTESAKKELPEDVSALADTGTARQLVVTVALLIIGSAFGFVFRKGIDQRLVRIAVVAVGLYLLLSTIIVGCSLKYLFDHPQLVSDWWEGIRAGTWKTKPPASGSLSWFSILLAAALLFPHVALGLSGYELTLASMPLIRGNDNEDPNCPRSRVRRARWMLVTSALLMSLLLLTSSFVVSILIPAEAFETNGQASNRALAYLAHGEQLAHGIASSEVCPLAGTTLGAAYDFVTIVVLTLAGVTVLIGTREIIPPYLHRLGMDTNLSKKFGILMYLFMAVKIGVTVYYRADVDAQRSAYLTGVLALFTGASITAMVDVWKRRAAAGKRKLFRLSPLFTIASIVFAASLVVVAFRHPVAIRMASCFVVVLLGTSMVTRFFRTRELRFDGFEFANPESKMVWEDLTLNHYPMLVPVRDGGESHHEKEVEIRKVHRLPDELAVVFIQAQLGDPSDFEQRPRVTVTKENGRVVVRIANCSSIPHAIAAAALEIAKEGPVPEVHFGWSAENPLTANINFVLFGQGNVPWMVYELIRTAKVADNRRPRVMVG